MMWYGDLRSPAWHAIWIWYRKEVNEVATLQMEAQIRIGRQMDFPRYPSVQPAFVGRAIGSEWVWIANHPLIIHADQLQLDGVRTRRPTWQEPGVVADCTCLRRVAARRYFRRALPRELANRRLGCRRNTFARWRPAHDELVKPRSIHLDRQGCQSNAGTKRQCHHYDRSPHQSLFQTTSIGPLVKKNPRLGAAYSFTKPLSPRRRPAARRETCRVFQGATGTCKHGTWKFGNHLQIRVDPSPPPTRPTRSSSGSALPEYRRRDFSTLVCHFGRKPRFPLATAPAALLPYARKSRRRRGFRHVSCPTKVMPRKSNRRPNSMRRSAPWNSSEIFISAGISQARRAWLTQVMYSTLAR